MESLHKKPDTIKESDPSISFIVFKLGTEEYAIRIEQVKEVTHTPAITRMPRTPQYIRGVANVRGDIIAIMDLEERFNIQDKTIASSSISASYTLVVERDSYNIGIAVKNVPQTLTLLKSQIDNSPALFQEMLISHQYIQGIGKLDGRLIIILDIYKILSFEEEREVISNL